MDQELYDFFKEEWNEDFGEPNRFDAADRLGELDQHGNSRKYVPDRELDDVLVYEIIAGQEYAADIESELGLLTEELDAVYECPNCRTRWTQEELLDELFSNEDWVVLVQGANFCPDCHPFDLF